MPFYRGRGFSLAIDHREMKRARKKTDGLRSRIEILTLPAETINNIIGGERRLLSKAKLVSNKFNQNGVNKIAMCESAVNDWCLATGQGDEHWEYNKVEACWQCQRATVRQVIEDIATLNNYEALVEDDAGGDIVIITVGTCSIEIDEKHPYHVVGDLDLHDNQLTMLPESFGSLIVGKDLWLNNNRLTTLPESFGSLTVGGHLRLYTNQLTMLPESFGSLAVGKDLYLEDNQLTRLPESFGSLTMGGDLTLSVNQMTMLPESFGSLTVGGHLRLSCNQLTMLPESFGSLTVGGDLWLNENNLTSLPPNLDPYTFHLRNNIMRFPFWDKLICVARTNFDF